MLNVADVAAVALRRGVAAVGAMACNLVLVSPDGQWLDMVRASGYSDELVGPWQRFAATTPVVLADAARTGVPVWLGSPDEYVARYPDRGHVAASLPYPAHAALPLMYQGSPIGALGVSFARPRVFDETDRRRARRCCERSACNPYRSARRR